MWKRRERKPLAVDIDHMKVLNQEAIEQLELMSTALEASELATGTMRDSLDTMAENHWHSYMDIIHMVSMHDEDFAATMKKQGTDLRDEEDSEYAERKFAGNRELLLILLLALIRRHQRFIQLWALRSSPMTDYFKESMAMEREHTSEIIAIIQGMV